MTFVIVGLVVVVVLLLGIMLSRGGPRQEPGVVSFRKHIDALSPEARREVMDRVRPPRDENDGSQD
ncbi:MAG: hypothetical protein GYA65_16530 [Actinobacteria bacterium]|nr:hypothetical protein [Acidimicrobiaceae bacterium]MBP6486784.1 hypothetical protein [Ilumatobacteraceae bacterium]NMD25783.1 hypothetical protein [Actinomycetota bacterium]MBK9969513.1 hypothetical protein [Acidimicrobiaceae bacterium]MBP7888457.1 hypothetical protein [Ilumatobacteraceae bacterium]